VRTILPEVISGTYPLTNVQLTLLNKLGVPTEKIGDSTGEFKDLAGLA